MLHDLAKQDQPKHGLHGPGEQSEWVVGSILRSRTVSPLPMECDIMSKKAGWISPYADAAQRAACKMRDLDINCLPIGENARLVGMVTDRDIACPGVCRRKGYRRRSYSELDVEWYRLRFEE